MFLGRPVQPGQPTWTEEDRNKVRAVIADRAERCSGCGTYPEDSRLPNGMPDPNPKWVPTTHRCYICEQAEKAREAVPSSQRGVTVRLIQAPQPEEVN